MESAPRSGVASAIVMAFLALGVVYGDIGTSPIYTFSAIFHEGAPADPRVVLGAMSTIFWTLTSIVLVKYALVTLAADDHGEGGLVALYALISSTRVFYIHHWFIFWTLAIFTRFNHPLSVIALGLCIGIFVQGAAAYGADNVAFI